MNMGGHAAVRRHSTSSRRYRALGESFDGSGLPVRASQFLAQIGSDLQSVAKGFFRSLTEAFPSTGQTRRIFGRKRD
jgi:hypothetical protein